MGLISQHMLSAKRSVRYLVRKNKLCSMHISILQNISCCDKSCEHPLVVQEIITVGTNFIPHAINSPGVVFFVPL